VGLTQLPIDAETGWTILRLDAARFVGRREVHERNRLRMLISGANARWNVVCYVGKPSAVSATSCVSEAQTTKKIPGTTMDYYGTAEVR
jgi:hypothetical protein